MISFSAPVVTDKGSNIVSGLRDSPRLDCICHRLHTVFTDAYKESQRLDPEVKKYEDAAAALCKYVKQATGIQEALPVSIKHGGNTRPWTSIYRRAHSIHESYTKLSEKLTERGRLPLLAAVNKDLNKQILDVTEIFNLVFENLCTIQHTSDNKPGSTLILQALRYGRRRRPGQSRDRNPKAKHPFSPGREALQLYNSIALDCHSLRSWI